MGNNQAIGNNKKLKEDSYKNKNNIDSRRLSSPGIPFIKYTKKKQFFKKRIPVVGKINQAIPPKIQINGEESLINDVMVEKYSIKITPNDNNSKPIFKHSVSVDSPYYLERDNIKYNNNSLEIDDEISDVEKYKKAALTRRMKFLNSSGSLTVRSLDSGSGSTDIEFEMKPFSRTRSYSPLRYIRSASQRSLIASDPFMDIVEKSILIKSWKILKNKVSQLCTNETFFRFFGICVFERLFKKMPELLDIFNINDETNINTLPEDHILTRHAILLSSLIDLAIRNIDQLETELSPALLIYGQRHIQFPNSKQFFSECVVRCLCAQVVCTVAELLLDDLEANTVEAWVDILRYMGRSLLAGYDNEK
ncbi:Globin family and Globin-like domain and Globin,structural domain-containing protein [Strongyloides ratti]|uniref:Globin family and Globin-like domain and Globin,structural domain-containing protein n=1 Tax=Strongyloides ratti TaxID=34506 RepID=A0A090KPW7_STRRB|nr:Globin family and Globin-like domain and Globin,structural domain-containing protein [Strongyloides ratti]CEF59593.1 Globin family and Globin-like domain and Globin,structural domain-containing protein [Strongyloides ratti]